MTDKEKIEIIGQIVFDHKKASDHLACLHAKRKQLCDRARSIMNIVEGFEKGTLTSNVFTTSDHEQILWPESSDVCELFYAIGAAKQKLASLEEERKKLGV